MTETPHRETCALVTGAAQGLGLAVARQLAVEGCRRLVMSDLQAEKGAAAAEMVAEETGAEVRFIAVDMGDHAAARALVEEAAGHMGRLDVLVNCAANTNRNTILNATPEDWEAIMNPNAKGPFFALQRFAQLAVEAGRPAAAVNIQSVMAHCGLPFVAVYSASKAALANITRNSATALAEHRIRVNGINVGWMDTPGEDAIQQKYHDRTQGWLDAAEAGTAFGRLVKPEDVARQVTFLTGPLSGVVTGSCIDFDQVVMGSYPDNSK